MSSKALVQTGLNSLLILCLVGLSILFLAYTSGYGLLLAPVAWVIAFFVFKQKRWGYFCAAVWSLACYQLAKEGLDFEMVRRIVMMLSIPLVVLSIYLHETLGRQSAPRESRSE